MSELVPLRGGNPSKPRPQNRILVLLGVFFKMSYEHPPSLYMRVPPGINRGSTLFTYLSNQPYKPRQHHYHGPSRCPLFWAKNISITSLHVPRNPGLTSKQDPRLFHRVPRWTIWPPRLLGNRAVCMPHLRRSYPSPYS